MSQPILSIITINYNNKKGLIKTINSISSQSFAEYEHIIIDGGSTDNSTDVIKQYQNKLAYWVSEKDNGIYDGMNKGIEKATGKYLLFLNSGDCLVNENVLTNVHTILLEEKYDIVYGNVFINNKKIKYGSPTLNLFNVLTVGISHQAMFFKNILFKKAGLYNISYKIIADTCHLITCLVKYNASSLYINTTIAEMEPGGISTVSDNENAKTLSHFMDTEFKALADDYKLLLKYYKKDYLKRATKFLLRKLNHA